jgi:hypothetical protein
MQRTGTIFSRDPEKGGTMKATKRSSTPMDPSDPPRVGTGPQSREKRSGETAKNSGAGTGENISTNTQKQKDQKQLGDESAISDETTI